MKSLKAKIGFLQQEIPVHYIQFSEIISAIKPFFNVSKIFGIPSFNFIDNVVSKGGFWSVLTFVNTFFLLNQVFLLIVRLIKGDDFVKKSGTEIVMRVHVICVHLWSLVYSTKLASALRNSPLVDSRINKVYNSTDEDYISPSILHRKCLFWTGVYVLLGVVLTLKTFVVEIFTNGSTFGETWDNFGQTCGLNKMMFFHSSVTSTYCLLMDFATNFVWIFGDFLLVILATVMGAMFWRLNNKGIKRIQPNQYTSVEIDLVREHHGLSSKLVAEFDDAISVLNFISVVLNTVFLVLGFYSVSTFVLKNRERRSLTSSVNKLFCKLAIAAFKLVAGLVAASVLHCRAHEAISEVRSWPSFAREFQETIYNSRASVIHTFLAQLSYPSIGFTVCKFSTITAKLMAIMALGVGFFFVFARITISSCSRASSRPSSSL